MIVCFHLLTYFLRQKIFNSLKYRLISNHWSDKIWSPGAASYVKNKDGISNLEFCPRCYVQRYSSVYEVIMEEAERRLVRKVVDFGCAELSFFLYLKQLKGLESVISVDIDENLLQRCACRAEPGLGEYVSLTRSTPFSALVCCGSVDEYDPILEGVDVVVAIELIEHLESDTLAKLPANIFARIQPQLAIFTTPNVEFNTLFPNLGGMRHDDHKFEWTRKEFEEWASGIVQHYPEYFFKLYGIGPGPAGTEDKGCCTQMAVFRRREDLPLHSIPPFDSNYKIIRKIDYPYFVDTRTDAEKVTDEINYRLPRMIVDFEIDRENEVKEIPLDLFLPLHSKVCSTVDSFRLILEEGGWRTRETNGKLVLVVPEEYLDQSDERDDCYGDYTDGAVYENCDDGWANFTPDFETHSPEVGSSSMLNGIQSNCYLYDIDDSSSQKTVKEGSVQLLSPGHNKVDSEPWPEEKQTINFNGSPHPENKTVEGETKKVRSLKRACDFDSDIDEPESWSRSQYSTSRNFFDFETQTVGLNNWTEDAHTETANQAQKTKSQDVEAECWGGSSHWAALRNGARPNRVVRDRTSQRLAKSFSLDSCLENINCERAEVQVMYLSMHSRARTLESGSPSERGLDSGYPVSFSQDLTELADLATSDDSLSAGEDPAPIQPRAPLPLVHVENGDVANNNRDGEGNNVEGMRNPLPPPFMQQEFPPWLLHLLWVEPPPPPRDEGLGDDSGSELSDSPIGSFR